MNSIAGWFNRLKSISRLLFCLGFAVLVLAVVLFFRLEILTSIGLAWDAFCVAIITLSWITFATAQQGEVRSLAQQQDESRSAIFILVLASVCISLVGILLVMKNTDESLIRKEIHTAVSLLGVALSWILLHTVFTLRYAHMYYTDPTAAADAQIGGLDFPEEKQPDYLDFAYFSFVVGMTFQVSDVVISSKAIRRVVLLHGLISFVFNTIIVALTIGFLSSLSK